jgi:hypothetical protein
MYIRLIITGFLILLNTSCGFTPLYNDGRNVEFLNHIKIGSISTGSLPQKLDHVLKIEFEKEFGDVHSVVDPKYILDIKITKGKTSFGSKSDSTTTRMLIVFTMNFTLKDIQTSRVLFSDEVLSYDSFQITDSPYSTFISEEENFNRIAQTSVNEMKIRLLSYFSDSKNASKS